MNDARRFFFGLLLGAVSATSLYFVAVFLSLGAGVPSSFIPWSVIDSKLKIANSITGGKIIFTGGSSVDNGINAHRVGELTGLPSVNMGFWASLGPEYILHQVKRVAKPGDLVVLILEYGQFNWAGDSIYWADREMLPLILCRDQEFFLSRPLVEQFHFAIRMDPVFLAECLKAKALPVKNINKEIFSSSHNFNGDVTNNVPSNLYSPLPIGSTPKDPIWHLSHPLPPDAKGFRVIADFIDWARKSGVKVVATYPNVARNPAYEKADSQTTVKRVEDFYRSMNVPLLGGFEASEFPPECFFDTHYHLQADSAVRRSELLIPLLEPYLPGQSRQ
jgi:hypothetical protein